MFRVTLDRVDVSPDRLDDVTPARPELDAAVEDNVPRDLVSVAARPFAVLEEAPLATVRPAPISPARLVPRTTSCDTLFDRPPRYVSDPFPLRLPRPLL